MGFLRKTTLPRWPQTTSNRATKKSSKARTLAGRDRCGWRRTGGLTVDNAGALPTAPAFADKLYRAQPLWINLNSPSEETYKFLEPRRTAEDEFTAVMQEAGKVQVPAHERAKRSRNPLDQALPR